MSEIKALVKKCKLQIIIIIAVAIILLLVNFMFFVDTGFVKFTNSNTGVEYIYGYWNVLKEICAGSEIVHGDYGYFPAFGPDEISTF